MAKIKPRKFLFNPSDREWQLSLPMKLTMSRVFMVPFVVAAISPRTFAWSVFAALLFGLASITDYYDGYFARKYNATSNLGKLMDPIADKIMVSSILILLLFHQKVDAYMVILIIARDTFIGGIRSVAAADQIIIDAKPVGKWKAALQMIAIPAVLLEATPSDFTSHLNRIGYVTLWISTLLSLISGAEYYLGFIRARAKLKEDEPFLND